jgi:hypothetical protein
LQTLYHPMTAGLSVRDSRTLRCVRPPPRTQGPSCCQASICLESLFSLLLKIDLLNLVIHGSLKSAHTLFRSAISVDYLCSHRKLDVDSLLGVETASDYLSAIICVTLMKASEGQWLKSSQNRPHFFWTTFEQWFSGSWHFFVSFHWEESSYIDVLYDNPHVPLLHG